MRLFLYGTLLDPRVLAAASGEGDLQGRPAVLRGWRRVCLRDTPYPTLRRDPSARVDGLVVLVGAPALRRLTAYEGPSYRRASLIVETADGRQSVSVWIAPGGTQQDWNPPR